MRCSIRITCSV